MVVLVDRLGKHLQYRTAVYCRCAVDLLLKQCNETEEEAERRIADTCDIFRLLIRRGANVDTPSVGTNDENDAKTPPIELCENIRIVALIRCLIEEGADVKAAGKGGVTLLHLWMRSAAYDIEQDGLAHLMLDRGADVNAVTDGGCTPLHFGAAVEEA